MSSVDTVQAGVVGVPNGDLVPAGVGQFDSLELVWMNNVRTQF